MDADKFRCIFVSFFNPFNVVRAAGPFCRTYDSDKNHLDQGRTENMVQFSAGLHPGKFCFIIC